KYLSVTCRRIMYCFQIQCDCKYGMVEGREVLLSLPLRRWEMQRRLLVVLIASLTCAAAVAHISYVSGGSAGRLRALIHDGHILFGEASLLYHASVLVPESVADSRDLVDSRFHGALLEDGFLMQTSRETRDGGKTLRGSVHETCLPELFREGRII
ncbi:hypothetical protein PMAYCL1PPCAC_28594, partial [Pristionchus mayeri]